MTAPAATKLFMNWVNVSVTPNGGNAIPITQVTSIKPKRSSRQEKFYGDALAFAALIKNVERERSIAITGGNIAAFALIPDDTPCTITATLADPRNGVAAGGGAITITLINAVLASDDSEGQNNKFASGTVMFQAYGGTSTDGGEVDPLTVAYA